MADELNYLLMLNKPSIEGKPLLPNMEWKNFYLENTDSVVTTASIIASRFPSQIPYLRKILDGTNIAVDLNIYTPYAAWESTIYSDGASNFKRIIHFPYHESKPLSIDYGTMTVDGAYGATSFLGIKVLSSVVGYVDNRDHTNDQNNIAYLLCKDASSVFVMKYDMTNGIELDRIDISEFFTSNGYSMDLAEIGPHIHMFTNLSTNGVIPTSYPSTFEPRVYVMFTSGVESGTSMIYSIPMNSNPMTKTQISFSEGWDLHRPYRVYTNDFSGDYVAFTSVRKISKYTQTPIVILDLVQQTIAYSNIMGSTVSNANNAIGRMYDGYILYDKYLTKFDTSTKQSTILTTFPSSLTDTTYGNINPWLHGSFVMNYPTCICAANPLDNFNRLCVYPVETSTNQIDNSVNLWSLGRIETFDDRFRVDIPTYIQVSDKYIAPLYPVSILNYSSTTEQFPLSSWKDDDRFSYGHIVANNSYNSTSIPQNNISMHFSGFRRYPEWVERSNCFDKDEFIMPICNSLEISLLEDEGEFIGKPINLDAKFSGILGIS